MKPRLIQSPGHRNHGPDAQCAQVGAPEPGPEISPDRQFSSRLQVKPVYTLQDFCRDFGICRSLAYEEIRGRRLRAYKVGASTRIAGEDALAWREIYRAARAA
jgi:hypothetical protein